MEGRGAVTLSVQEQSEIGWEKLLLGMGSHTWQKLQDHIDAHNPVRPSHTATDWMNSITHQFLIFSLRCWNCRNTMKHGATLKERHQIDLQRVRDQITDLYSNPPILDPQFRAIDAIPLDHRLKISLPAAEHWLVLIAHQTTVTAHNRKVLLRQHMPIQSHLRTMRLMARSQAKDQLHPLSPRKAHSRAVLLAVKLMKAKLYAPRGPNDAQRRR